MLRTIIDLLTSLLIILPPLVMFGLSLRLLFDHEDFNFDWLYRKIFPTGRKASAFSFGIGGAMLVISILWIILFFKSNIQELLEPYLSPTRPAIVEEVVEPKEETADTADAAEQENGDIPQEQSEELPPVPAMPFAPTDTVPSLLAPESSLEDDL